MNLEELSNIDPSSPGDWPGVIKAAAILLLCAAVGGAGYYFDTQHQIKALETAEQEEVSLKADFEKKQAKAANYERYKQQVEEMKQSLGAMLRQLPNKTEVANLLVDVSQTGLGAGLEFELFDPGSESPQDFYAELPITLRVKGGYHEFGDFVSGLAALPRIVTIHDISISGSGQELTMSAKAKTYRYLDAEENAK